MIECLRRFLVNIARVFLPKDGTDADNNGSEDQPIVTSKSPKQYSTNSMTESMQRQFRLAPNFDTYPGEEKHKQSVKYLTPPEPMHLHCVGIPAEIAGYEWANNLM